MEIIKQQHALVVQWEMEEFGAMEIVHGFKEHVFQRVSAKLCGGGGGFDGNRVFFVEEFTLRKLRLKMPGNFPR